MPDEMERFDLIRCAFPTPETQPLGTPSTHICRECVRQHRVYMEPDDKMPAIDRRRINPNGDLWAHSADGMLVSDRVRAILSICCPRQVQFVPVSDCTHSRNVMPGYFLAWPLAELCSPEDQTGDSKPCMNCGQPIPIYRALATQRCCWNGADVVAGPLLPEGSRHHYVSRRLLLLLKKLGVRGTRRFYHPQQLEGDGPVHDQPQQWAESNCAAIPTERTFRLPPPDEAWFESFLSQLGEGHTGLHPRALMAWQHTSGVPLPPSFRSMLFKRDGFSFELTGRTRTQRITLTGGVRVAGLAEIGQPSLRQGRWEVPSNDQADSVWDGLPFARMQDGTLWCFDLSRPSNLGEYPVFRYDPKLRQPVEFLDHFVDWVQECWPGTDS